jgi:hypothetical protein
MRLRIVSDVSMLPKSKIKRFTLGDRRFRYEPKSGKFFVRSHRDGVETKTGCLWREIKFSNQNGYFCCGMYLKGVATKLYKHRLVYFAHNQNWNIFDSSMDNMIDHINHNPSDNRIKNLRVVTHQQNNFNRSDVKGYHRCHTKWRATIYVDGKRICLGRFKTEEEARNAYLKAKAKYHII